MYPCWNPLVVRERRRRREPIHRLPRPSWSTARRHIVCMNCWIPGAGAVCCSIWSTGRGSARRSVPGWTQAISWIPLSQRSSTDHTRRDRPPDHVEDPGVVRLLASGAARRGRALSRPRLPYRLLSAARGSHPLSIDFPISPRTWGWLFCHTCTSFTIAHIQWGKKSI